MTTTDHTGARPLSRSALIGGGIGAAIALAARTLGAPPTAVAATGSALVLGTPNDASSTTALTSSSGTGLAVSAAAGPGLECEPPGRPRHERGGVRRRRLDRGSREERRARREP